MGLPRHARTDQLACHSWSVSLSPATVAARRAPRRKMSPTDRTDSGDDVAEALRSKGNVTQAARDKYGARADTKGMREGSFPVWDFTSAKNALKLRGHAPDPDSVIAKVAAWAKANGNTAVMAMVQRARAGDDSAGLKRRIGMKTAA